ncbi:MAG: hypothetical protein JST58_02850 [Bacteroidetes bacterium]|nr:hypothetical protein [Bacteroidota bacterium]
MKKYLAIALLISIGYTASAQSSSVFEKGTNVINAGIGLGNVYWGTGYSNTGMPVSINASFDHGITDKLGIGYIGVGGAFGYSSSTYNAAGYKWNNTAVLIGGRATYHFALNSEISEKLDPYAGVILGYVISSSSNNAPSGYNYSYGKASAFGVGAIAGAHYYFFPNFGVYAELGYSIVSVFNTGVTFKF